MPAASYRGAKRSIEAIWNDWITALARTRLLPSVDPPGTPFSSNRPRTAKLTLTQTTPGTRVPNSQKAMSGVKTT